MIPLLSRTGIRTLFSVSLVPLAGVLLNVPGYVTSALMGGVVLAVLARVGGELIQAHRFFSTFTVGITCPARVRAAWQGPFELNLKMAQPIAGSLSITPSLPPRVLLTPRTFRLENPSPSTTINAEFIGLQLGDHTWKEITVRLCVANALTCWQRSVILSPGTQFAVIPNYLAQAEKAVSFTAQLLGTMPFNALAGEGYEFDALKKYSYGNDLRRVDWKRSARTGSLLVKTYRPETHQRLLIALDCSRRMLNRVDERTQLEHAVDAVAYLVHHALGIGDEVGMMAFHAQLVASLPVTGGAAQEDRLFSLLSTLNGEPVEPDYDLIVQATHQLRRRTLIVLVTSVANPSSLEAIYRVLSPLRRKHLPIVVVVEDVDLQLLAEARTRSLKEAFVVAAARTQQLEISERVEWLARAGIPSISARTESLGPLLVEQHRMLKLSGRL